MKEWKKEVIKKVINNLQWIQEAIDSVEFEHKDVYVQSLENDMDALMELIK